MAPVTRALLQAKTVYLYYRINFSGKVNLRSCLHGLKLVILDESIKGLPDWSSYLLYMIVSWSCAFNHGRPKLTLRGKGCNVIYIP